MRSTRGSGRPASGSASASRVRANWYDRIDTDPPEELRPFAMQEVIAEKERELAQLHGFTAVDQLLKERDAQLAAEQEKFSRLSEDFQHNLKLLDGRDTLIAKLQQKASRADAQRGALQQQVESLQQQLQQSSRHGSENRERWETTQLELEGVKVASSETIAKLRGDVVRLETKYEKLLGEARAEAAAATTEAKRLQEAAEGDARHVSGLETRLLDAETQVGEAESQVKAMASTLKEADLRIQQLEHEMERQRLEYKEGAEKQLKRDVLAVKKYYEEKMDKLRGELSEDYETKYGQMVESLRGMETLFAKHKQQQGARLRQAVDEAERWKDEADELRGQMQTVQRRVQVLQDDYARLEAQSSADAETAALRDEVTRQGALDTATASALAGASDGLHVELKTKLKQALSEREASDARARELQSELDRQRLANEKLEVQLREGNDAVMEASARQQQAEAMLRRADDSGSELARQVVWGALMAQLADAYVDVAIASQKAEASAATGDADEIVEAQMALRRVKEAVRRARHGLRGASRAQQLRLSEPEAHRMAEDTQAIDAEIRRCKARSTQGGVLGGELRDKYKALKKRLAKERSEVTRLTKLLDDHEISMDIHERPPRCSRRSRRRVASAHQRRSVSPGWPAREHRATGVDTASGAEGEERRGQAGSPHRRSADVRGSISAVLKAAQTAISHREAAEAQARKAGIEVGGPREGVGPRRLGAMRRSFSPRGQRLEEADVPQLASPEVFATSTPRSRSKVGGQSPRCAQHVE
eukprot:jgi/Tetstr1/422086/TSEL_012946.t1